MSTAGTLYNETITNGFAKLLSVQTAASSASLNFGSEFSSVYDSYFIDLDNIYLQRNDVHFIARLSFNNGATYEAGSSYYWSCCSFFSNQNPPSLNAYGSNVLGGGHLTWIMLTHGIENGHPIGGRIRILNGLTGPTNLSHILWRTGGHHPSLYNQNNIGGGFWPVYAPISGIQFLCSAGLINSGNIRLYGLRTGV